MNRPSNSLLRFACLVCYLGIGFAWLEAEDSPADRRPVEATLYGSASDNQVKLYWETRNWPEWLTGFRIRSRPDPESPWMDLHDQPILPSFMRERNWANQGLNEAGQQALLAHWDERYAERIPEYPSEELLVLLRGHDGLQSGDRLAQKLDFNMALYGGFAFVHEISVETSGHEYGLFATDDSTVIDQPISTWSERAHPEGSATADNVEFGIDENAIVLKWEYANELARNCALFGFLVDRQDPTDGSWTPVVSTPQGQIDGNGETGLFRVYDNSANPTENQRFAIVAVDMFQNRYSRIEVNFEADRYRPLVLPEIAAHRITNDTDVRLEWQYPSSETDWLQGFYIERVVDGEFVRISDLLGPEIRDFTDDGSKTYGNIYDYRLVAVNNWDREWAGPGLVVMYLGQTRPPSPDGLAGRFHMVEGQPGILLEWNPVTTVDARTARFRLLSDVTEPGVLRVQSHIEPIRGNRFFYPLNLNAGRLLNVGLLPITEEGISGEAATVQVYLPTIQLPPVTGLQSQFDPESYTVQLAWDYANDIPDLLEFRILMDGSPIQTTDVLSAETREVTIESDVFEKGRSYHFSIVALGGIRDSLPSLPSIVWIGSDRLPEGVEAPAELSVEMVDDPDSKVVELTWKPAEDFEESGLVGYALMVDYAQPGNIRRLNSLPPLSGPSFRYVLPDNDDRESYTFRLAAITKENTLGPHAEAVLELPLALLPEPETPETELP